MKHLFTIVLFCTTLNTVYSQTVTPVPTGEFCPPPWFGAPRTILHNQ